MLLADFKRIVENLRVSGSGEFRSISNTLGLLMVPLVYVGTGLFRCLLMPFGSLRRYQTLAYLFPQLLQTMSISFCVGICLKRRLYHFSFLDYMWKKLLFVGWRGIEGYLKWGIFVFMEFWDLIKYLASSSLEFWVAFEALWWLVGALSSSFFLIRIWAFSDVYFSFY